MNYVQVLSYKKRAKKNPKIKFIWDSVVDEIQGDKGVGNLVIKNVKNGSTSDLKVDGIFHLHRTQPQYGNVCQPVRAG